MVLPSPYAVRIELTSGEREQLESWSRRHTSAQALALRARIVLTVDDGLSCSEVARRLGINVGTAAGFRSILEVCMLTLWAPQAECLWDESLPVEVKELPADLAELDRVLRDPELMMVLLERWRQEVLATGRALLTDGRPTIAMETYVRLMVLKARYRWGYRVLVAEVSDSIHPRGFAGSVSASGCRTSRPCAS